VKKGLIFVALISLLSTPTIANAAVKSGASCKKLNQISISNGKKYTCIKSGKKLAWNKGEAVPKVPTVVIPESWALDKPAQSDIFSIADQSVRKKFFTSNPPANIKLNIGPTTDNKQATEYIAPLLEISKLWKNDWNNSEPIVISLANVNDFEWMRPFWAQYGLTGGGFDDSKEGWGRAGEYCNQGSAILASAPFLWGCMPIKGDLTNIGTRKFSAHEYTHLAQYGIIRQSGSRFNLPVLISEGSADFYGITAVTDPMKVTSDWEIYFKSGYMSSEARTYLKNASLEQIETLLLDAFNNSLNVNSHWYYTGAYVTIRLVAAKGHNGFVSFMKDFAASGNASTSFEKIYGMQFTTFVKIVAPEILTLTKTIVNR
jgi:hypothetical protein